MVPSPAPVGVEPLQPIGVLLDLGYVVICGGGGGVPVCMGQHGLEGVEAVVDKDAVSALIAEQLGPTCWSSRPTSQRSTRAGAAPTRTRCGSWTSSTSTWRRCRPGSMRPKVEAAARFARSGGRAVIGSLSQLGDLVSGRAGTQVVDSAVPVGSRGRWLATSRSR